MFKNYRSYSIGELEMGKLISNCTSKEEVLFIAERKRRVKKEITTRAKRSRKLAKARRSSLNPDGRR